MILNNIISAIHRKIVERSSPESKIKYFRKRGMKIGSNCNLGTMNFMSEPFLVEMGNRVIVASGTVFITHDGAANLFKEEVKGGIFGKIRIGNNVFIGANSIILFNTSIGDNCIIGAGSVVRGRFPDNSVIVGNPAKVVMNIYAQKLLYRQNPGFVETNNLSVKDANELVKKHFGIR